MGTHMHMHMHINNMRMQVGKALTPHVAKLKTVFRAYCPLGKLTMLAVLLLTILFTLLDTRLWL